MSDDLAFDHPEDVDGQGKVPGDVMPDRPDGPLVVIEDEPEEGDGNG